MSDHLKLHLDASVPVFEKHLRMMPNPVPNVGCHTPRKTTTTRAEKAHSYQFYQFRKESARRKSSRTRAMSKKVQLITSSRRIREWPR